MIDVNAGRHSIALSCSAQWEGCNSLSVQALLLAKIGASGAVIVSRLFMDVSLPKL
jgi:hypothetical protein